MNFFWLNTQSKGSDHDLIIVCIRRLIKKFGEELTDEWNEIFKILIYILKRENLNFNDTTIKNLIDIADTIKILIINSRFFGNLNDYTHLIDELKFITNESLSIMKMKMKLYKHNDFISNLESVIIENFLK